MARRVRKRLSDTGGGAYFLAPPASIDFIPTGATPLDRVLGGGWARGRVSNVIGDKSTGKTLLAIEAMANFAQLFPKERCRYGEAEAAFDLGYAEVLGCPLDKVKLPEEPMETVEAFFDDIQTVLTDKKSKVGLYILDSLDALSDVAEMKEDIDKGSYGTGKAKKLSQTFRRIVRKVEQTNMHLMIVSQTRQRIGVTFGRQYTRGGGKALDFYASQILYLSHVGEIARNVGGIKRTVGIDIKAKCTKNKVGFPFRTCDFPILLGYGIQDIAACIDWLITNKQWEKTGHSKSKLEEIRKKAMATTLSDPEGWREVLSDAVNEGWREVETTFLPKQRKYTS